MKIFHTLKGESHINFRTQFLIMTQTRWPLPPLPCHICHFHNFDKTDSFLKAVLNIFILGNLIVDCRDGVRGLLKRELVLCIRSIDLGGVNSWESRLHQSKSWHYLGHSQTSKLEFLAEIVFGYKPLTLFIKISNLNVWLVS